MRDKRREVAEVAAPRSNFQSLSHLFCTVRMYDDLPVVGFRERRLLVPKQPAMAVGGVDDVHVAPDEWPAGRGEGRLGVSAFCMVVVLVTVFNVVRARAGREGREGEREERGELHGQAGVLQTVDREASPWSWGASGARPRAWLVYLLACAREVERGARGCRRVKESRPRLRMMTTATRWRSKGLMRIRRDTEARIRSMGGVGAAWLALAG